MATVSVAILGMGRIGASMALALRRYNARKDAPHQFDLTCGELRPGVRDDAQKVGLDRIERDLFRAAQGKDIVVLALPYADVQAAYRNIAADLRPGAVVLDAAPLKQLALQWAQKHLPREAHMVGITPILNPAYLFDGLDDTLHAKADLFDNGNMLLMPAPNAARDAVELAADFSSLLGSTPHFFDPAEHDSLIALTDQLPALLGVALFHMLRKKDGWNDAQRITNPAFGRATRALFDAHPDDLRDSWLNNRDNLLRGVDDLIATLRQFREALGRGDRDALEAALIESSEVYSAWINRRHNARWEQDKLGDTTEGVTLGGMVMGGLMGGFLSKKLTGSRKDGR